MIDLSILLDKPSKWQLWNYTRSAK